MGNKGYPKGGIKKTCLAENKIKKKNKDVPKTPPGKGVKRPKNGMNATEAQYAQMLEQMRLDGEVVWWMYEPIKLNLAPKTTYTPDFLVMKSDGILEVHEVKGVWRDDARVKIKVAADKFPFRFIVVRKTKGGWEIETLGVGHDD